MRDIKTLTIEEIEEFLNKTELGDHKIVFAVFDENEQEWNVGITTKWEGRKVKGEETLEIEDYFTFNINMCYTNFPFNDDEILDSYLYHEFLLAKGFIQNRFEETQ